MATKDAIQREADSGDAGAVARRVESIQNLFQVRGNFERFPVSMDDSIEGNFSVPVARADMRGDRDVTAFVHMGCELTIKGKPEDGEQQPDSDPDRRLLAKVEASFVVRYRLSKGPAPKPEDLQAFAHANGAFNVNPYWREFLSSSLVRAGMPQVIAPVMTVAQPASEPDAESDQQ